MSLTIDTGSPIALHEQVEAAIRRAIAEGEAGPGERLPPARDLAAVLGVNPNTVLRALRTLRDEGLLEFRRGRGVTVAADAPLQSELILKARELLEHWDGASATNAAELAKLHHALTNQPAASSRTARDRVCRKALAGTGDAHVAGLEPEAACRPPSRINRLAARRPHQPDIRPIRATAFHLSGDAITWAEF